MPVQFWTSLRATSQENERFFYWVGIPGSVGVAVGTVVTVGISVGSGEGVTVGVGQGVGVGKGVGVGTIKFRWIF